MKGLGKIAVCLAGGLVLSAGLRAQEVASAAASAANPYGPIVVRNVFGLNPPPLVDPNATQVEPPPKITPNGIMSINGQAQVLYKVAPKPGVAGAKEESYVLSEGQGQDDIEVVRIDEKGGVITFNNHGTVQEIPLANAPAIAPSAAPGMIPNRNFGAPVAPGVAPAGGNSGGIPIRFGGGSRSSSHTSGQNHGMQSGNNNAFGGGPAFNTAATPSGQQPEDIAGALERDNTIENQRDAWAKAGKPTAIIPPTIFTPPPAPKQ